MRLSQVWTVEAFAQSLPASSPFRDPGMTWPQVCSTKTQVPMLAVGVKNSEALCTSHLLFAALRSMIANNIMHAISAQPILLHTVATAGGVMHKRAAVNLYGDFTALRSQGAFAKQCLLWVLKVDDPEFEGLWREVHELTRQGCSLENA